MSLTAIKEPSVIAKLKEYAVCETGLSRADAEQLLTYIRAIDKANTRLQDDVKGARKEGRQQGLDQAAKLVEVFYGTMPTAALVERIRNFEQPVHDPSARPASPPVR